MFLILFIAGIIIVFVSSYFYSKSDCYHKSIYESWNIIGSIISLVCGSVLFILVCVYTFNKPTISNKIEMYEEENNPYKLMKS